MTDIAEAPTAAALAGAPPRGPIPGVVFAGVVFFSASLVFMVEPMIARLILPLLGGSAAVWNTSLAFFQLALLAGYLYAHLLQRLGSVRRQIGAHIAVLVLVALVLPLHVTHALGEPPPDAPALWLLGVLSLSIGAPFAALSATAPLVQAWHAQVIRHEGAKEPYGLYAASNIGSLLALVAYPALVEPSFALSRQAGGWSLGYGLFVIVAAALGVAVWRVAGPAAASATVSAPRSSWRERLTWLILAAIPSSLMLGVTSHVTTDIGSAPFLWVAPLALYLVTFIIAFQDRPLIAPAVTQTIQAAALALCAAFIHGSAGNFLEALAIHLTAFFFTALMCHQALVARRPEPARLTEFYIWMSLGGVVGGAFNAFVAPVAFNSVVEYPAVLVLSCLVRPWGRGPFRASEWALMATGVAAACAAVQISHPIGAVGAALAPLARALPLSVLARTLLGVALGCAVLLRRRALTYTVVILALIVAAEKVSDQYESLASWRPIPGRRTPCASSRSTRSSSASPPIRATSPTPGPARVGGSPTPWAMRA